MVEKVEISRTRIGIVALVFAIASGVLYFWAPEREAVRGSLQRMALLLGALWLAAPSKYREAAWAKVSPWVLILGLVTLVMLVKFPFVVFPILAGLFFLSMFVRPMHLKKRPQQTSVEPSPVDSNKSVIDIEAEQKS